MTNFPPFVQHPLQHPWMGMNRYQKAEELLSMATDDFDVKDCFNVLKEVSQTVCPTKQMRQIMNKFQERNGATQCKLLKGVGTGKVLRECSDCVADAAEFLEEQIG